MSNRRSFLVNSTLAAAAVSFFRPLNGFANIGLQKADLQAVKRLTILHTSNLYGQLAGLPIHTKMYGLGGLKNIRKKIAEIRNEQVPLLAIHTGNIIGGSHRSDEDHLQFYKQMCTAGYDAVIPGKSDLQKGGTYFESLALQNGLNTVAGKSNLSNDLFPSQVVKKGNNKVGIIHVQTNLQGGSEKLSINNLAELMNKTAHSLKEKNQCNLVVCMVQSGKEAGVDLAELSVNVDLIVNAVNNNSIHNSMVVRNKNNHEVIVSSAGSKGTMMSRLDFTFNDDGEKVNIESKSIFIGAEEGGSLAMLKRCNYSAV